MMPKGSSLGYRRLAIVLLLGLSACANLPVQELSDARQAIEAAKIAGGEQYSPTTLEQAERLAAEASRQLARGDYHDARATALLAKRHALLARQAALSVQVID